jgi:regulatory protein
MSGFRQEGRDPTTWRAERAQNQLPATSYQLPRAAAYNLGMAFKRTQKIYDEAMLYEYAVGALGRKMRTVAELKRLMRERVKAQYDGELLVEVVTAKLKEQKYLSDTNYAESYSRFRKENEKFGRMRVVQDLKTKGVHGDIIDKTVGAAYQDVNEEQLARDYLQRKRISKPADQRGAARVFRSLMRAGFASRVIFRILKMWEVDDETISVLESEAAETERERESR